MYQGFDMARPPTLSPGEQKLKQEWDEMPKVEQWGKHLDLYRRYKANLMYQIQGTASALNRLEVENQK